jgi:hypothetical protein
MLSEKTEFSRHRGHLFVRPSVCRNPCGNKGQVLMKFGVDNMPLEVTVYFCIVNRPNMAAV